MQPLSARGLLETTSRLQDARRAILGLGAALGASFLLALPGAAVQGSRRPLSQRWFDFLARLEARDARIRTLSLAYRADVRWAPDVELCPPSEIGWWYWEPDAHAAAALIGCEGEQPRFEHVVWDGAACTLRSGPTSWDVLESLMAGSMPRAARAEVGSKPSGGPLNRKRAPGNIGLFAVNTPWSAYLGLFPSLHEVSAHGLESEQADGSIVVVADFDAGKGAPWRMVFDEQRLLLRRYEIFGPTRESPREPSVTFELDGVVWHRRSYSLVLATAELAPGFHIPTHAVVGMDVNGETHEEVRIDPARSALNAQRPAGYLDTRLEDAAPVDDPIRDEPYHFGHEDEPGHALDRTFMEPLQTVDEPSARRWEGRTRFDEPLGSLSLAAPARRGSVTLSHLGCEPAVPLTVFVGGLR